MGAKLMKSTASFAFHLEGGHEIDAEILARTIKDVVELTKLAAQEENSEAFLKMNVTAFKKGSFQIDFSAICEIAQKFLLKAPEAITFASTAILTLKGFLEIKALLKGKKPKKVEPVNGHQIRVENQDGDSIIVNKSSGAVINNIKIDQVVINIANDVKEHNPNGGFKLSTEKGDFTCNSHDVTEISKALPIEEVIMAKRYIIETPLIIKKPDILAKSMWSFLYDNRTIFASIEDTNFIERVHKGELALKAHDYIHATLQITIDMDMLGNPIDDTAKYTVLKVHGDIHHQDYSSSQMEINL